MELIERLRDLFAPRVTITQTTTEMTPEQSAALLAAFNKMGEAFDDLNKAMRK